MRLRILPLVLWPGYWGWEKDDVWGPVKKNGGANLIYQNTALWKLPLIQSNFSHNDLEGHKASGPHGLSMFVNSDNLLFAQGEFESESCYVITVDGKEILGFEKVGDL